MGVIIHQLQPGDGVHFPKRGGGSRERLDDVALFRLTEFITDIVTIHYLGTLLDGSKFDSSYDRGVPFVTQIGVGKVIRGWDEGVPQLSLGEKALLTTTADYAYGERGFPPHIPSNATLNFEVELIGIN
ncbi:FK506 binding protein proline rotamase rapamycin-binding protein [Ceratobasidium sp. 423]|nr:FK506 binding protein proline rotamase rapamycin-binding protein [Ceratobasidium sp. 423]